MTVLNVYWFPLDLSMGTLVQEKIINIPTYCILILFVVQQLQTWNNVEL
jgi:hypothetical protein